MSIYGDYVIPPTLASSSDLTTYSPTTTPPANVAQILAACSQIVLDATEGAIYDVDVATGLATNSQIKNAMRDMTCAQAAAWIKLGIDPDLGGVTTQATKTSKKIGSAAVTYSDAEAQSVAAMRQFAMVGLVPTAARIGRLNDLLGNQPYAL